MEWADSLTEFTMPNLREQLLQQAHEARGSAARARRLARTVPTPSVCEFFAQYAIELDAQAAEFERGANAIESDEPDFTLEPATVPIRDAPVTPDERQNYLRCPKCEQWFDVREIAETGVHLEHHLSSPDGRCTRRRLHNGSEQAALEPGFATTVLTADGTEGQSSE